MTGRWITAGLVALALTGCSKKEAAKPPPPATETTAPAAPPTATPPTTSTTTTSTTTTTPPATPPTTETPPPSGYMAAPSKWTAASPDKDAKESKDAAGDEKIVKSKVQLKAERDVLGAWREQRKRVSVLRFAKDGWVSLQQGGGDAVRNGKWTADKDGAIHFTFSVDGGEAKLTAHPTDAATMAVVPSSKGPQIWPGYGQLIFQRG